MTEVVFAACCRTPIGSYGKSLRDVPPSRMGAKVVAAALERAGVAPDQVEHVVFGNVIHTEPADMYMARVVGVGAGIPVETPAYTVNRLCGTGVQAIISAAQAIQSGDVSVAVAGGAESMSRGPYWMPSLRWGARMGATDVVDAVSGALTDPFHGILMGVTAENLAEQYAIGRQEQDDFAVESHRRATAAQREGRLAADIVPLALEDRHGTVVDRDEHIRPELQIEALAALRPVFKEGGTVTAGNASGMNDAAAAAVLLSRQRADELGVPVIGRLAAYATCGVDPRTMGIGPVPAVRKVLDRAGISLDDVGVIELNEAFAAQALAVIKELELDPAKVNPMGGAIALGHPIAATGTIVTAKALSEMQRGNHRYGLVTLCIGGGQGIAMLLERPSD